MIPRARSLLPPLLLAASLVHAAGAASERWERLGDAGTWGTPCRVGDEARPAAGCDGAGPARLTIALPTLGAAAGIEIAVALRAAPGRGPTRVRAALAAADGAPVAPPWERRLDPAANDDAGWQSALLPAGGTEARTLVLEAEAADDAVPATPVVWARPILRRADTDAPPVPGIALVVLDGLRADRLVEAGRPNPATPVLGRLVRAGVVFARAWSPTPDAGAAHRAMLTGQHPCRADAPRPGTSIARRLAANGWATALIGDDAMLARLAGFDRAFTVAPEGLTHGVRLADRWLDDAGGAPFLLVVQSAQAMHPDRLPPTARRRIDVAPDASPAERARARYDAAVSWVDDGVGGLLGSLTRRGLVGRAAILVTSAVGYELGERGRVGPASSLHAESLHVPLVVHHPATAMARQVPFPVELGDLAATIADLAGLDRAGTSLLPLMRGGSPPARHLFADVAGPPRSTAARTARFAWMLRGDTLALHDLGADPAERRDVAAEHPAVAADGRARIDAFRAECERPTGAALRAVSPDAAPVVTDADG